MRRFQALLFTILMDGPSAHRFTTFAENGIPVSFSEGAPLYEGELFTYEEVCRLEQDESREETILYRASLQTCGPDGRYYVTDIGNGRIAVFGSQGKYFFGFGRAGDGPGEFRSPHIMTVDQEGLLVFDRNNRRTTRFGLDGIFREYVSLTFTDLSVTALHPLPGGKKLVVSRETDRTDLTQLRSRYRCQILGAAGDTAGTVIGGWNEEGRMRQSGNILYQNPVTFSSRARVQYESGWGILCWDSSCPELRWFDTTGSPSRIMRLDWERVPVTDSDRLTTRQRYEYYRDISENEQTRELQETLLKNLEFADYHPFWASISVDEDGYLWLRKPEVYADWEPEKKYYPVFRVLNPEGEYLGDSTQLHRGTVSRGKLLTQQSDEETGEVSFIIYEIIPIPEDLVYPR